MKRPFGGEDIFSRLLGKWLAKHHHKVTLMGIDCGGIRARHLTYYNNKDKSLISARQKKSNPKKFGYGYLLYSLRAVFWISQVLRILSINLQEEIDVIHAQDSGYTGLASIIAGKILGISVIITLHSIRYKQIESNPYINEILKRLVLKVEHRLDVFTLRHADIVTLVNPTLKYYVEQVAPKSTIVTIPTAIKTKDFEFSEIKRELFRKELEIGKNFRLIGYIGRLSYEKNLFTLLDSFGDAARDDSSLRLVLVGEGPLELELRKKAGDMLLDDKVIFCGFRNDISKILSSLDIFVLPSFFESTSIALLEAMTCGRAIICSDISSNCELVTNNNNAILISPNDRNGFKDAILLLSSDEMLRGRLGNNAKIKASQYDEDIIFPRILRHYEGLST